MSYLGFVVVYLFEKEGVKGIKSLWRTGAKDGSEDRPQNQGLEMP
jgi:hypothetical protein